MADRILVVERDDELRESIRLHVSIEGYACDTADDADDAFSLTDAHRYDAVVLNMAIQPDGLRLCQALRSHPSLRRAAILLLSPASHEADTLSALERYVDDFLKTPFGVRELVARVRALVRRSRLRDMQRRAISKAIVRQELTIDPARRRVYVDGCQLTLTEHEFQLLFVLAGQPSTVFSRDELLSRVWGRHTFVTTRSVDTLVKRVRHRLRSAPRPSPYVVTVRGVGYKFNDSYAEQQESDIRTQDSLTACGVRAR